jgi:hypothetical protein
MPFKFVVTGSTVYIGSAGGTRSAYPPGTYAIAGPAKINQYGYIDLPFWTSNIIFNTTSFGPPGQTLFDTEETKNYDWSTTQSGPATGSFSVVKPSSQVIHTRQSNLNVASQWVFNLPEVVVTLNGSSAVVDNPSAPTYSGPNPLLELAGEELTVPYYVAGGGEMTLTIGGKTYTATADSMGLAQITFTIPENWDGTAVVNGQTVALAPKMAYTGTPHVSQLVANPYSSTLPPGMTAWSPSGSYNLPSGMTASTVSLPQGVSPSSTVPMPSGMTVGVSGSIGEYVNVSATNTSTGVTTSYTVNTSKPGTPATQTSGGTSGSGAVSTGAASSTNSTGSQSEGSSLGMLGGAFNGSGDTLTGPSDSVISKGEEVRSKIGQKFGNLNPVAGATGLPMQSTFNVTIQGGMLGSVNKTFDFSQPPWTYVRMAELFAMGLIIGAAFVKRVSI